MLCFHLFDPTYMGLSASTVALDTHENTMTSDRGLDANIYFAVSSGNPVGK